MLDNLYCFAFLGQYDHCAPLIVLRNLLTAPNLLLCFHTEHKIMSRPSVLERGQDPQNPDLLL